jgi:hypothetical protein
MCTHGWYNHKYEAVGHNKTSNAKPILIFFKGYFRLRLASIMIESMEYIYSQFSRTQKS